MCDFRNCSDDIHVFVSEQALVWLHQIVTKVSSFGEGDFDIYLKTNPRARATTLIMIARVFSFPSNYLH